MTRTSHRFLLLSALGIFSVGALLFGGKELCHTVTAASICETKITTSPASVRLADRYLEFSPETLAAAHTREDTVVLYFWAPWCSTCSTLDHDLIEGVAAVPDGITLLRVNYDQASELKERYSVAIQHTFVQLNETNEAKMVWVGGEIDELVENLK